MAPSVFESSKNLRWSYFEMNINLLILVVVVFLQLSKDAEQCHNMMQTIHFKLSELRPLYLIVHSVLPEEKHKTS